MVDPTGFLKAGLMVPGAGDPGIYERIQGNIQRGRQARQAAQLGDIKIQAAQQAMQQAGTEQEREGMVNDIFGQALEKYRANDIRGFQQDLATASQYAPKRANELFGLLNGIDKTNAVAGSYDLLGATTMKNATDEEKKVMIRRAIEKVGANTTMGRRLQEMLTKSGDELDMDMVQGVKLSQTFGFLPGLEKLQAAARKERELDIEEQKFGERAERRLIDWTKISMDEDHFNRRMAELSAGDKKILEEGIQGENQAIADAEQITGILGQIEAKPELTGGGVFRQLGEYAKRQMGVADSQTAFTQMLQRIRVDQGIKNLPPGVASDKDIELVMSGIPEAKMGKDDIISWLRGRKKLAVLSRVYHESKNDWLDTHPNQRGFASEWRKKRKGVVQTALQSAGLSLSLTEQGAKDFGTGVGEMGKAVGKLAGQVAEAVPAARQAARQVGAAIEDTNNWQIVE